MTPVAITTVATTTAPTECISVTFATGHSSSLTARQISRRGALDTKATITVTCDVTEVKVTWEVKNKTFTTKRQDTIWAFDFTSKAYSTLKLSATALEPGVYSVHVTAVYSDGANTSDVTYVNVMQSPLEVAIDGGTYRTVKWGQTLLVDALSRSFDPDSETVLDRTGLSFSWTCTKTISNVEVDVPSWVTSWTSLSAAVDGYIYLDTAVLTPATYTVNVNVTKDVRSTAASQTIRVIDGFVPDIKIRYEYRNLILGKLATLIPAIENNIIIKMLDII